MLPSNISQIDIAIATDIIDRHSDSDRHRYHIGIDLDIDLEMDLDPLAAAVLQNKILCWTDRELCHAGGLKIEW